MSEKATKLPTGWYWCVDEFDKWWFAFIDEAEETVSFIDGFDPVFPNAIHMDTCDALQRMGIVEWHGPFHCPGGEIGQSTVVNDMELQDQARELGHAMITVNVDFKHCKDGKSGGNVTVSGTQSRCSAQHILNFATSNI